MTATRVELAVAARPELVRYALRLTGNAADAEDVVHDAYVRVLAGYLDTLTDDGAVLPVMWRIVERRCFDLNRRKRVVLVSFPDRWAGMDASRGDDNADDAGDVPAALIDPETPELLWLRHERRRLVRVVVAGLRPAHRDALVGRYWRDDPAWERDPLKHRTWRARRRFRAEWEQVA